VRKRYLLLFPILSLLLCGCFQDETPCSYFSLIRTKTDGTTWKVDSFQVFIYDPVSNYKLDTVYLHDGTFKFVSSENRKDCADSGTIIFTPSSGPPVTLTFQIPNQSQWSYYQFCMQSLQSIDRYPGGNSDCPNFNLTNNKLYLTDEYFSSANVGFPTTYFVRAWAFTLSKD
jgi:hypothetical protein